MTEDDAHGGPKPAEAPTQGPPRNCGSCRHFVNDPKELVQEFEYIAKNYPIFMRSERQRNAAGIPVGAGVERVIETFEGVAALLYQQYKITPDQLGLCEKGFARLVTAPAIVDCGMHARQADGVIQLRPKDWKSRRDALLLLMDGLGDMGAKAIGRNDPCFCKSGRKWKHCHGASK